MDKKSRLFWFFNGVVFALLGIAAINCLSYFFRSSNAGLIRGLERGEEAIGFPLQIWSSHQVYQGIPLASKAVMVNTGVAVVVALVAGIVFARSRHFLNRFLTVMIDREENAGSAKLQFSIRGMLLITTVAAVVATLVRQSLGARPELLFVVYLLGPTFLILLAMIPRQLSWQSRVVLLIPSTILLIGYAVYVGKVLGLEFDRTMLRVCVFWIPQTVLAAMGLMIYHLWQFVAENPDNVVD